MNDNLANQNRARRFIWLDDLSLAIVSKPAPRPAGEGDHAVGATTNPPIFVNALATAGATTTRSQGLPPPAPRSTRRSSSP